MMSTLEAEKVAIAIESLNQGFGYVSDGQASDLNVVRERIQKSERGRRKGTGDVKVTVPRTDDKTPPETPPSDETVVQYVPHVDLGHEPGFVIQFKYGTDDLNAKAKTDLKKIHAELEGSPYKIIMKGHTSPGEHGSYRQGIDLAFTRAVVVRDYLVSLGMDKKRFQILILGEYEPVKRDQLPSGIQRKEADSVVVVMVSSTVFHK